MLSFICNGQTLFSSLKNKGGLYYLLFCILVNYRKWQVLACLSRNPSCMSARSTQEVNQLKHRHVCSWYLSLEFFSYILFKSSFFKWAFPLSHLPRKSWLFCKLFLSCGFRSRGSRRSLEDKQSGAWKQKICENLIYKLKSELWLLNHVVRNPTVKIMLEVMHRFWIPTVAEASGKRVLCYETELYDFCYC